MFNLKTKEASAESPRLTAFVNSILMKSANDALKSSPIFAVGEPTYSEELLEDDK